MNRKALLSNRISDLNQCRKYSAELKKENLSLKRKWRTQQILLLENIHILSNRVDIQETIIENTLGYIYHNLDDDGDFEALLWEPGIST